jgi:hypothetical protein
MTRRPLSVALVVLGPLDAASKQATWLDMEETLADLTFET